MSEQHNRLYAHYLSGIITETQYHEAMADMQGAGDNNLTRLAVERYQKEIQMLSDFLKDIDTGGKYEMVRYMIGELVIEQIKKRVQTLSRLITNMSPAAYGHQA
jgi:hypothetical protein